MAIIVTGAAGFIGFHVTSALLARGERVIGIDNMNDYYDPALKQDRLHALGGAEHFTFYEANIADRGAIDGIMQRHGPEISHIVHLAAQAGVRYSIENPYDYVSSNIMGQVVLLESARKLPHLEHFVYASSSSIYGGNKTMPFSVDDRVDQPLSVYAATKKADEMLGQVYANLYDIALTGLRFFTVYGPWGRPDMAAYLFADAIREGRPIKLFNKGEMKRDFTYIDDIVAGVIAAVNHIPKRNDLGLRHAVYNLGNHRAERLLDYVNEIEKAMGVEAEKDMLPMQPGDVLETYANIEASRLDLGYDPKTPISEGIPRFIDWYKSYYGMKAEA